ncbi:MAG: hypothetical protein CSA97_02575 [Bacteroidetes bacterium]|nr:MAG: hypothetical protein CSA97_02575 [Bacteroidota bacterium]
MASSPLATPRRCGLVLLLALLCLLPRVKAQDVTVDTITLTVGARVGVGISRITFQPFQPRYPGLKAEGGVVFGVSAERYFGMQVELDFARTAFETVEAHQRKIGQKEWIGERLKVENLWLQLPILAEGHYRYKRLLMRLQVGGFLDYLLIERAGIGGAMERMDLKSWAYNRLGVGVCGGGGLGIATSFGNFHLDYRFNYRLTNLYDRERIPGANEPRSNPRDHGLSITYTYTFTKIQEKIAP